MIITIRIKPGADDLPLQRISILKLIDENVTVARIHARMQVVGMIAASQQPPCVPLQIRKIQHATVGLDGLIVLQTGLAYQCDGFIETDDRHILTTFLQRDQHIRKCRPFAFQETTFFLSHYLKHGLRDGERTRLIFRCQQNCCNRLKCIDTGTCTDRLLQRRSRLLLCLRTLAKTSRNMQQTILQSAVIPECEPRITYTIFTTQITQAIQWITGFARHPPLCTSVDKGVDHVLAGPVACNLIDRHQRISQICFGRIIERLHHTQPCLVAQLGSVLGQRKSMRHTRRKRCDLQKPHKPTMESINGQRLRTGQDARIQSARQRDFFVRISFIQATLAQQFNDLRITRQC